MRARVATTETNQWESIIRRAQSLDPEAFDAIVGEYSVRLYGFLRRLMGGREDAEELVQEVFVRVVRTIGDYEHDGRFEAWLFRIARNLARDDFRRQRRSPGIVSLDGAPLGDSFGSDDPIDPTDQRPFGGLERSEDADRLQVALNRLPEAEREVILMRHYGQMSFQDIAETMGTPLGTALARAHRGLAKLRAWMESES